MNISSGMYRWLLVLVALVTCGVAQASETVTYFHSDAAGSPMLATDVNGLQVWKETYRPYGDRLIQSASSAANDVWFAGASVDDGTGLSYMGARYYDATIGRFVAVDPLRFNPLDLHSLNRYAYANNNPFKFVDPTGESAIAIEEVIVITTRVGMNVSPSGFLIHALLWNTTADKYQDQLYIDPAGSGLIYNKEEGGDDNSGTQEAVDDVVKELEEGAQIKDRGLSGSRKVDKTGTGTSIDSDWKKLVGASGDTPKSIETQYGPGQYIDLPGGGSASIRPGSSGGQATIEINRPGMKDWKGRYD